MENTMRSEDFNSEMLFAPTASRPTSYRMRGGRDPTSARNYDTVQVETDQVVDEEFEFEWQGGEDGQPPSRKKMLCFTLRRLFRLRMEQSYRSIEETREIFLAQWSELKNKGQQEFMEDVLMEDTKKQRQRQLFRRVALQHQIRQGQHSLQNAFALWKECAVLQQRVQKARELTASMKNLTENERQVREQLANEHADLAAELDAQRKEFKRQETWLDNKIKRISLKSNLSKNRSKAIGVTMRTLLDRHRSRIVTRCLNRWFEHSKLMRVHELYKEDMLANQEEFVYVTWQQREKKRLEDEEIFMAKRQAETLRKQYKLKLEYERKQEEELQKQQVQDTGEFAQRPSAKSAISQMSFSKLSQPKTIPYQRINDCIVKLQRQFRKSRSERGSFQDYAAEMEIENPWKGSTGNAIFQNYASGTPGM